ncbi:MAG: phytanoyl-CoA dioxygenase [Rhodospirillaceae bacterium]|nr:phytanoyl-CoA dioxygenase [Rhodospirillaceae bacterium]MBT4046122.1 phytanoyl-CoA dioxygenase [Rhodospirillaceae bacterium]MBT4688850.1 phytanoyl-CoA dioxygenase [Rhodospirillaceae bacterium]MBT5079634.1 phytanoyl-CoA dioxygenase [Rhodospirillaceae bacterium]MBT5524683.1 phytanoyl-CoA dioxygenase [Rhodospirillaceae bacterium]
MDLPINTVPAIQLPSQESVEDVTGQVILREAAAGFRDSGVLLLHNAFPVEFVESLHGAYISRYSAYFDDAEHDDALKVGDRRFMVTVEMAAPFNSPRLYANPGALGIIRKLLGENCVLGSFGSVVSLPGAAEQHVHRDHPGLFGDDQLDAILPSFAVTMLVPLVEMNETSGTTRTFMGSHVVDVDKKTEYQDPVVPVGSCLLMDYRLLHGGLANRSSQVRPLLYNVYCRPWFRDDLNFRRQPAIKLKDKEYRRVPKSLQDLFSGRGDIHGGT